LKKKYTKTGMHRKAKRKKKEGPQPKKDDFVPAKQVWEKRKRRGGEVRHIGGINGGTNKTSDPKKKGRKT